MTLARALQSAARPARTAQLIGLLAAGAAAGLIVLAIATWVLRAGWFVEPQAVVIVWTLVVMLVAVAAAIAVHSQRRWTPRQTGALLEHDGAWRLGSLTTALDGHSDGTSGALHAAALAGRAREVVERGRVALGPRQQAAARGAMRGAAVAAIATIALAAARPARGTAAILWHPVTAVRALVAPVQLHARVATVSRGESATLDIAVIGHQRATLFTRTPGEGWQQRDVVLDADGRATVTSGPLNADLLARVTAGGRSSGEVRVAVRIPAFLGSFVATAHYPSYLGIADETLPVSGDTLVLPEGTELAFTGRATAMLAHAELRNADQPVRLNVNGEHFQGHLAPRRNGSWQLQVTAGDSAHLDGEMPVLPIRIVPDSAPVIEIPVPGADTIATPAMSLALVIGIRDDHGIIGAALDVRRAGTTSHVALTLPTRDADRALLSTTLDLAAGGAKGGDTVRYSVSAVDNAPARHVGHSREYVVRIPTAAEQRAQQDRATQVAATGVDSLSRQAARLQRTEEDLARERSRGAAQPNAANGQSREANSHDPLASDAARKAQAVADAQQQQLDAAAKLQQDVRELQQGAARQGLADTSLARQLGEINRLLDKAVSPELRAQLQQLQEAIRNLDADKTQQSLQDLAAKQAQFQQALEQVRELLKRAALETSLAGMQQDAKQLAAEQHAMTDKLAHKDSASAPAEEALARRADSLAAGLQRAAAQVPATKPRESLQQAAQQAQQAAGEMHQAAQASERGDQQQAQQQAKQADQKLGPLSKQIDDDRKSAQAEMRAEVKQALDRALDETARIAQRQLDVVDALQLGNTTAEVRGNEGTIAEGAAKLQQQLAAVARMNALVSPNAAVALAEARRLMLEAVTAAAAANPNARDAFSKAGDASDALAVAAFELMQSKDRVNQSQSGSGMQEAMEQMQQMAKRQGQLAQQGQGMMQSGGTSAEQMLQMAMQQRALAQQLERMRAGGMLPGAGQLSQEAKELAQSLQAGRLNQEVVDRQQRLFKRMLDAGRLLQGEEDDEKKERQSVTAKDAAPAVPATVDPRILNGAGDVRVPSWDALQKLQPEERRRVVEYFQRLAHGVKP